MGFFKDSHKEMCCAGLRYSQGQVLLSSLHMSSVTKAVLGNLTLDGTSTKLW